MNALTFPVQTIGPHSLSQSDTILDCPCSFSRQDLISDRSDVTFTLKCLWCALLWWYSNQQGLIESGFGNYSCGPVLLMEMSTILMSTAALSLPTSSPLTETVCMVWNTIYIDCSMATFNRSVKKRERVLIVMLLVGERLQNKLVKGLTLFVTIRPLSFSGISWFVLWFGGGRDDQ